MPTFSISFFKKKYALFVIILFTVIVAAALLVPQSAAKIPLEVTYTVGEKMVYYTTEKITIQTINAATGELETNGYNSNPSLNFTEIIDVTDFDGELYTLKHTQSIATIRAQTSFSFTEKINKTGYSTWIFPQTTNAPSSNRSGVGNPALIGFLEKSEVTVGDTWVIPVNSSSSNSGLTGNMTLTFVDIQNIAVPAGTFNVFRVDTASNDTAIQRMQGSNKTSTMNMTISGQTYIDYNTGRQIERNVYIKSIMHTIDNQEFESNDTATPTLIQIQEITGHTQLIEIILPEKDSTTPSSAEKNHSPIEQTSLSFLKDIVGLDLDHYNIQFTSVDADFVKCTLSSTDSSVDVLFHLNNSRIFWCKIYPIYPVKESPGFLEAPTSNLEAAKSFLDRYQTYAQTDYIPLFRSMIDHFSWVNETVQSGTFSSPSESSIDGDITLELTVNQDIYTFTWSKNGDTNQHLFALTVRNGHFEFFTDSHVRNGTL
jgi:hypothetical protein